jgi:cell division protein FtsZ
MLFITAGMGGGTGTGAAPVIARVAKEMGILTVGVVTKPFDWEGGRRMQNADNGLAELEANVDSLIVVLNEKLLEVLGDDITQDEAFAHANDVLKNAVGGIAEIINEYGHVNVDFEDVRTVMGEPGKAMMGTATASGPDRARIAAEQAVACPLLEGIDLSGAKGVLVLVTAARGSLKLSESRLAMSTINAYASPDAHVIYGAAYDDSLGDELRVTVVATGLSRANARRQPISVVQGGLRTGTDNMAYPMVGNGMAAGGMASGMAAPAGGADYGNMAVPSVWRTNRTQAAARVDALVSGGMDDLEIPAFLRKQAD